MPIDTGSNAAKRHPVEPRRVHGLCRGGAPPPLRLGTNTASLTLGGLLMTQAGPLRWGLNGEHGASGVSPFPCKRKIL